ncbi:hypothetical protein Bbelb_430900 [Branchiostoma belcheri]|nr:hypothetical protein Bbelb_430900 [Branchiostoma belcheri]
MSCSLQVTSVVLRVRLSITSLFGSVQTCVNPPHFPPQREVHQDYGSRNEKLLAQATFTVMSYLNIDRETTRAEGQATGPSVVASTTNFGMGLHPNIPVPIYSGEGGYGPVSYGRKYDVYGTDGGWSQTRPDPPIRPSSNTCQEPQSYEPYSKYAIKGVARLSPPTSHS